MGLFSKTTEINLGDMARDKITGFDGVITGRTEWINGCVRYALQSKTLKDGKILEPEWIDSQQIEIIKPEVVKTAENPRGGPMKDPKF